MWVVVGNPFLHQLKIGWIASTAKTSSSIFNISMFSLIKSNFIFRHSSSLPAWLINLYSTFYAFYSTNFPDTIISVSVEVFPRRTASKGCFLMFQKFLFLCRIRECIGIQLISRLCIELRLPSVWRFFVPYILKTDRRRPTPAAIHYIYCLLLLCHPSAAPILSLPNKHRTVLIIKL